MDYLQYVKWYVYKSENVGVLNLVINGLPSILKINNIQLIIKIIVLNLVINGLPSILMNMYCDEFNEPLGFKPCYKWITFNTVFLSL